MMHEWRDAVERWLVAHNTGTDLAAVWVLCICFAVMGTVNLLSVWALRGSRDVTSVGGALKRKKAAEWVACWSMSALYGLSLWGYYADRGFGPWWRLGIRTLVAGGLIVAGIAGLRFIVALRSELNNDMVRVDPQEGR